MFRRDSDNGTEAIFKFVTSSHFDIADHTRPHLAGGLERRRSVELGPGRPPPPPRILRCRTRLSISGTELMAWEISRERPRGI